MFTNITIKIGKTLISIEGDAPDISEVYELVCDTDAEEVFADGRDITEELVEYWFDRIDNDCQPSFISDDVWDDRMQDAADWARGPDYYYGLPSRL